MGKLDTFTCMYPVRLYLSATCHVLIPAFGATRKDPIPQRSINSFGPGVCSPLGVSRWSRESVY
jgi:hypothetical protein